MQVSRKKEPRKRLAHQPVTVACALVSQLTCKEVLGIDARRYLEAVAGDPSLPRVRRGKLVLTDPRDWLRALAPAIGLDTRVDADEADSADDQLDDADAVLAAIGHRRVGGSSR